MATTATTVADPALSAAAGLPAQAGAPAVAAAPGSAPGAIAPVRSSTALAVPAALDGAVRRLRQVLGSSPLRQILPALALVLVAGIFAMIYSSSQSVPYRAVYPGMQEGDQQAAFDALKNAQFKPQIDPSSGHLQVPANRYHEARIFLAAQGLPKAPVTGLDALKDHNAMNTSQFMEQVKVNAAMEQELVRSITQISSIQSARVHLATPKQSVFVRDRTPPKAAVVVTPFPGRPVSSTQVQAIVHLVSSSVPYLAPEQVTVVDNYGKLMTESPVDAKFGMTTMQTQHKQGLEQMYRARIDEILAPLVGQDNVRSQVNLVLDFTQIESTQEDFDARDKGPKTRSEVLAEDRAVSRDATGVPGTLTNQAPPNAAATTNTEANATEGQSEGGTKLSSRATRNYELDRKVLHVKNANGGVQRVTASVVINERPAEAKGQTRQFSDEEMQRMLQLVRGVVGYDEQRGDVVNLVQQRFEGPPPPEVLPWYSDRSVHGMIRDGLMVLGVLGFLGWVARFMNKRRKDEEAALAATQASIKAEGELSEEDMRLIQIGEGETLEQIKAKLKPKKSNISAEMLDTANTYDDKVALVRMLVAEDSARVANVLKGMINVGK
jgi:flagellar M-ring protein FliF